MASFLQNMISPDGLFAISDHGYQRLKERVCVSDRKCLKLVEKAWNRTPMDIPKLRKIMAKTQYFYKKNRVGRELMGYVFIFALDKKVGGKQRKTLVTVI